MACAACGFDLRQAPFQISKLQHTNGIACGLISRPAPFQVGKLQHVIDFQAHAMHAVESLGKFSNQRSQFLLQFET